MQTWRGECRGVQFDTESLERKLLVLHGGSKASLVIGYRFLQLRLHLSLGAHKPLLAFHQRPRLLCPSHGRGVGEKVRESESNLRSSTRMHV